MTTAEFPDELKPYVVTVKDGGQELVSLEFRHDEWVDELDNPAPLRVVVDNQDWTLPIEAGAPLNAGESVLFKAFPVKFQWPDRSEDSRPVFRFSLDDVDYEIVKRLEQYNMDAGPTWLIAREYAPDGSGPYRVFDDLTMVEFIADDTLATVVCGPSPATATRVPRRTYRRDQWPL